MQISFSSILQCYEITIITWQITLKLLCLELLVLKLKDFSLQKYYVAVLTAAHDDYLVNEIYAASKYISWPNRTVNINVQF